MENEPGYSFHIRRYVFAAAAVGVFLLLLGCTLFLQVNLRLHRMEQEINELGAAPVSVVQTPRSMYTLREYDARIGVFRENESTPMQILDICVFTLPETDRTALRSGIRIFSEEELCRLIEDFTG